MSQVPLDPRAAVARPGDIWVSVSKPLSGMGATKVRANNQYLFFERGTLRTDAQQIPLARIIDIDASQSMTQKLRGVGTVRVIVNRGRVTETVQLEDLSDFRDGVEILNRLAGQARAHENRMRNTQHVNYQGGPPQHAPQPPPVQQPAQIAPPKSESLASDEVFSKLEQLGQMKDKGWISEAEFNSKKAELLARL